jgi:hypothetical protein
MGQLGKCPTCNEPVSTSARRCPHCGEDKFIRVEYRLEVCPECKGKAYLGRELFWASLFSQFEQYDKHYCQTCGFDGKRKIYTIIDKRTEKERQVICRLDEFVDEYGERIY